MGHEIDMVYESWRKNLYTIFVAEFVVLMGFSFVNPFMPLFIQKLGNFNNREAALWAGIASGASGIAMFFTAPLWGAIADRWGRKPMLLRSFFGSAVVLFLTGFAPNIYYLIALRVAHGMLSGTIAAASALVSANTPRDRLPFAMGLLSVAMFGGSTIGPLVGGSLADSVGYSNTFFITSAIVFASGFIILFFSQEKFERPTKAQPFSFSRLWRLAISAQMLPILAVEFALQAGPGMVSPIIPLIVRELDSKVKAATTAGIVLSLMGLVSAISGIAAGHFGGRISVKKMLVFSCLLASLFYLPPIWAGTVTQLIIFVALTGIPKGGMLTSASTLVGLSVSSSQQGVAYGVAQSAKALGNGLGPLIGGALARVLGLKPIFGVAAGLFTLTGLFAMKRLDEHPPKHS